MTITAPNLDDLRFQRDLVDEARRRIIRYCPEWTDYNLSDPGITLIELFAWMTEMLVYRLNRVPERNYLKFLELMGVLPKPATSASTELTFYLSAPLPLTVDDDTEALIPAGLEVTTRPAEEVQEVTFTTDQRLLLMAPRLVQLRRGADFHKNYLPRLGVELFPAFSQPNPQVGDTFYLGFDPVMDIRGYILQLSFDCEETQAVGIRRDDPPWVWECSLGNDRWLEVPLSQLRGEKDTTGGLNNPSGSLVLYLPLNIEPDQVHGRAAFWLRCRFEPRRQEQGVFTESPRVVNVTAHVLGGTVPATHATIVSNELLGVSNGESGQSFQLQHAPVLELRPEEQVEVEEMLDGQLHFRPWSRVADFSDSDRYDRHFCLDEASGTILFGPAVRQPDGSVRQYGRVPESGRQIRLTQYRYGGGVAGNVPAGRIQMLRSTLPYIDRVRNFKRASGGRDQESLEELKLRAQREMRAQQRAVTAEDFENLTKGASRAVARVRCLGAGDSRQESAPGSVDLLIVPAAADALNAGDLSKLALDERLRHQIQDHLDRYRLLTTTLCLREPSYLGVSVHAEIVVAEFHSPETVRANVDSRLRDFLSPLATDGVGPPDDVNGSHWEGWPFGRDLFVAELFSLIQQVPGVKHVLEVEVHYRPVWPRQETGPAAQEERPGEAVRLTPLAERRLLVPEDTLICSLDHQIEVVEI